MSSRPCTQVHRNIATSLASTWRRFLLVATCFADPIQKSTLFICIQRVAYFCFDWFRSNSAYLRLDLLMGPEWFRETVSASNVSIIHKAMPSAGQIQLYPTLTCFQQISLLDSSWSQEFPLSSLFSCNAHSKQDN